MAKTRWKKRRSPIGQVVGDPICYDRLDGTGAPLATIRRGPYGWSVAMPNGDTAGPYGDLELAQASATRRMKMARRK